MKVDLKTASFCNHNANLGFNQLMWFSDCQVESEDQETQKGAPWSGMLPKARESVEAKEKLGNHRSRAEAKAVS